MWRRRLRPGAGAVALGLGVGIGLGLGPGVGPGIGQQLGPGGLARHLAAAQGNPLPPGEQMALVLGVCIPCHSAEMVAQQRLDRPTWEVIVDRMITYGAPITPETRPLIIEYLVRHLGPG